MFYSQEWVAQDKFVCEMLENKQKGVFLDIGCHHYKNISNTYYLEKELGWSGLGIDLNCSFESDWVEHRSNSKFICADATILDYNALLKENNMPPVIDYLSLDLEPPELTLKALEAVLETDYVFRVVTFETDYYRQKYTRDISRQLFMRKGYKFMFDRNSQDDFYVHTFYKEL